MPTSPSSAGFYSKARPWSLLKTKVEGPVTTDREPAEVQAWVQSVRFFYDLQVRRMRDHRGSKKAPLVQGLPDGFQTVEEEGRKVAEGLVEDGHMQGPWVFFHKNGKKSLEGTFKNSRWEGEVRAWHINGNRKSVMGVRGRRAPRSRPHVLRERKALVVRQESSAASAPVSGRSSITAASPRGRSPTRTVARCAPAELASRARG